MSAQSSDVILERMMSLHPKIIDLTLDRVWRLLDRLGNPERNLPPVVHIAGTNGKGSTLAMLRAGLEGAKKHVHVYTSPHLVRFHERIRLAGTLISEDDLSAILDDCMVANGSDAITYFEITTVAGLLAFSRTPADFALLETGLGGRLDATNVVARPALTLITPVSADHQQFLGNTLTEIAGEKAGILKPGVTCVVSRQDPEALEAIENRADEIGAPLLVQGRDWDAFEERGRLIYQDMRGLLDLPPPALMGAHQFQNAGAAIAGLRHLGLGDDAPEAAVRDVQWPARMQRLTRGALIEAGPDAEFWLDGGHNPACAATLAESLSRLPERATYLVCGMMNTKDVAGYMAPLVSHARGLRAVSIAGEPNTLPAADTQAAATAAGIEAASSASVGDAVAGILRLDPQARILICGSLYLAGRVLADNG